MKPPFKIGYIDTVHGICPHCHEDTLLVAVVSDYYKCTMCWIHCSYSSNHNRNQSLRAFREDGKVNYKPWIE